VEAARVLQPLLIPIRIPQLGLTKIKANMDKTIELENRIVALETIIRNMMAGSDFPLEIDQALSGRGFIKLPSTLGTGVVKSNGDGTLSVVTGDSGSFYGSSIVGAATDTFVSVTDGIVTTV
jgi:hypothetical protein